MKVEHSLRDKTLYYITGKGSPLHKFAGSTSNTTCGSMQLDTNFCSVTKCEGVVYVNVSPIIHGHILHLIILADRLIDGHFRETAVSIFCLFQI